MKDAETYNIKQAETYNIKQVDCPQCGVPEILDDITEYDQQEHTCGNCGEVYIILDGASHASLKVVNKNDELEKAAKRCARTGNHKDLQDYLKLRRESL